MDLCAFLLAVQVPAASWPETGIRAVRVEADAPSLLAIGERLEAEGKAERARTVYTALQADPSADIRAEARYRLAGLAITNQDWRQAALLLRRVLDDRPNAAPVRLALAEVLNEIGDEGAALRELRAAQAIGLPLEVARMVDRYSEALRARRPFGASIEIAVAPDSNINTATASDTLGTVIGDFEIDPGGKEKSGIGVALRGSAFLRHALDDRLALLARASASLDLYRDKDFNQVALDLAAGPELRLGPVRLNVEAGATRRWYAMNPFEDHLRVELNGSLTVGRRGIARARFGAGKVDNHVNDLQDGRLWTGEIGVERAVGSRSGVGLTVGASIADLADPGYSTKSWRAQLLGWREMGRVTVHASATMGRLEADERLSLFPETRKDRSFRLSAGATVRQLQVRGFAPLFRFTFDRNVSNIAFHDYRRRRLEFGVVRAF